MKWEFFRVRKCRKRTFIHNLCPLCGRRRGASSADRVGRDPCVLPRSTHCSRRGTRAPPGATGCGGRMGRTESFAPTRFVRDVVPQGHLFRCAPLQDAVPDAPCHCEPVRAAKQVPLGYRLARQSVFPALALDKPVGMGIIVDVRGRCDKRSAPVSENFNEPYGSQKPSLVGVAVLSFNFITRIETEYRPMWKVSIQYMYVTPFRGCD